MRVEVPIFVQQVPSRDEGGAVFRLRPLFDETPTYNHKSLEQAMAGLVHAIEKRMRRLVVDGEFEQLNRLMFCPRVKMRCPKLRLELRRRTLEGRFPIATVRRFARQICVSPLLPTLWFEVLKTESLVSRATEVFEEHFRRVEREADDHDSLKDEFRPFQRVGRVTVDYVSFQMSSWARVRDPHRDLMAALASMERMDGRIELEKVGRNLDELYPDHLQRAIGMQQPLKQLQRLLNGHDKRPVLIVGPPSVGKTAMVHEFVSRRVARRRERSATRSFNWRGNVWLLGPQRLISGMKYVGMWEERLLAILRTSQKNRHILFFDDVLGLYDAGQSANSTLSVADLLKPYVQRGDVRMLGEITPDALRVFRERDRGFADLFHLIHLEQPDEPTNITIQLGVVRELEARFGSRYELDVLPAVIELTRRYQREMAFPGKAARLLTELALTHRNTKINRKHVLEALHAKSGLDLNILDSQRRLTRNEIEVSLGERIIGQPAAIQAMADTVSIAKAGFNDPKRPLGSFLFLGPTGVGKTESAKALASFLFGNEDRLLRFDMNEFVSAHSVARLVGSFGQPEGLLTSAIREQPYCVVLFDEIEKAHPDAFDLMLQILDEARLTDTLGRTVSFGNAIVILTSNLGSRKASREIGFTGREKSQAAVYQKAVREFFRPEFLNRIDHLIPFQPLDREALKSIADRVLTRALQREGFSRRRCVVELVGDALDWLIERGYHPTLGARAMKRAIEDELVHPVAAQLTTLPQNTPVVLSLARQGPNLRATVHELREAAAIGSGRQDDRLDDPQDVLRTCRTALERMRRQCAEHRPAGELGIKDLTSQASWYLWVTESISDTLEQVDQLIERVANEREIEWDPVMRPRMPRRSTKRLIKWNDGSDGRLLKEMYSTLDIHEYLRDLLMRRQAEIGKDALARQLLHLLKRLRTLQMWQPQPDGWVGEKAMMIIRSATDQPRFRRTVRETVASEFRIGSEASSNNMGLEMSVFLHEPVAENDVEPGRVSWWQTISDASTADRLRKRYHLDVVLCEGPSARTLLHRHQGTYLFTDQYNRLHPVQVVSIPLVNGESFDGTLVSILEDHERSAIEHEGAAVRPAENEVLRWLPVVCVFGETTGTHQMAMDFRPELPLPPEFNVKPIESE